MAKVIFQDIKKTKSIRNINKENISDRSVYTSTTKSKIKPRMHFIEEDLAKIEKINYDNEHNKNKSGSKYGLWIVAIVCIGALLFALSFLFSKVKVVLVPKNEHIVLNQNLTATKEAQSSDLVFSVISLSDEEKTEIEGSEEKEIQTPARGVVVLFNAFSSSPQKLDIDTRLEGSNGKIYKTDKKITIPGMSADGTPGKVEVGIYASSVGPLYNSAPLDFKILGFKGSSKYVKFYGRSKEEITGGLVGKFHTISDIEKQGALSELKAKLEEKLYKKALDQIPEGFIFYKDAVFFNVDEEKAEAVGNAIQIPIVVKGTLYGFLIEEKALTDKIAKNVIEDFKGEDLYLSNIKELEFSMINKDEINQDVKSIDFTLKGETDLIWKIDEDKIITDLLGKNKKYFNQTMSIYPNIKSAELELFPPWTASLPNKKEKINLIVNYPK